MEETLKTQEVETVKPSYEQLEAAAIQLQRRALVAEEKLRTLDAVTMRLNWLFKVVDNEAAFSQEFVEKCVKEIEDLLTIENVEEVTPEEA